MMYVLKVRESSAVMFIQVSLLAFHNMTKKAVETYGIF